MKRYVFSIIFLLSIISVSANYLPTNDIILGIRGTECLSNGSLILNITHNGRSMPFSDINLTIESDTMQPQPVLGNWFIGEDPVTNYDFPDNEFTGNDFTGIATFRFVTSNNIYTTGTYTLTVNWPGTIYYNHIKYAIRCPGKACSSNDECVSQQTCSNKICQWLVCGEGQIATGHTCINQCNDNNKCTKDYFIDGKCVYTKINNCNKETGNTITKNIFARFWDWLKSRYE